MIHYPVDNDLLEAQMKADKMAKMHVFVVIYEPVEVYE